MSDTVPENVLEVSALDAGYRGSPIIRDVSFSLGPNEILGIVGRNGVGKTTLVKAIMGLLPGTTGNVSLRGRDLSGLNAAQRARAGLGYVPQGRGIFTRMTVVENLKMGSLIGGGGRPSLDLIFEWFPVLAKRRNQKAGTLSGGEQQMLAIGRALIGDPGVLLLDEPSEGVQPSIIDLIEEVIRERNQAFGLPVIVVEQNIDMLEQLAHRCIVIEKGRIAAVLSPEQLAEPDISRKYLAV